MPAALSLLSDLPSLVAIPEGHALPCYLVGPNGGSWPDDFSKKNLPFVPYVMSRSHGGGEARRRND